MKVLLQDCGVEDYLLLGREGVEFSTEAVQVSVYDRSAPAFRSFEKRMLDEMGKAAMVPQLIPRSAFYAQSAVSDRRAAFLHCILQSAFCCSAYHFSSLSLTGHCDCTQVIICESRTVLLSDAMFLVIAQGVVLSVDQHLVAE